MSRPNIVLAISDQHNPHFMGCADHPFVQTPNLDELAKRGARLTNVYCPYPLCAPSRAAFMAGQYASDIGVYDNGGVLSSDTPTFAHALNAAGYETVLCGRMHFNGPDQHHGFEKRIHGDTGGKSLSPEILGSGYRRTNGQTHYAVEVSGHGRTGFQAYDQSVTRTACEFIRSRQTAERPYCLVVGLMLPHNPLICDENLFNAYLAQIPPIEPEPAEYLDALHPAIKAWRKRRGVEKLTPEQNRRGLAAYCGLVTELDRNVGHIIDAAQSPDTVLIYCSDHGDMACEHGLWWKSNFYEGSANVPFIASYPDRFQPRQTIDAVASLIDVGPTLLDLANADPLPDVAGRSFAGFLTGHPPPDWPHETFSEYIGLLGDQPTCMIRSGPWKLNFHSEFDSCQLFNLEEDPEERSDLANDPQYAERVHALRVKIDAHWSARSMLENRDKQQRARTLIRSANAASQPAPSTFISDPNDNHFDFAQLPPLSQDDARPVDDIEREAIAKALRATGGHRKKAAERLGISEQMLYRKIRQYGL